MISLKKYIAPPSNCTGCGLCANVCSHDAITMVWNRDGFLMPRVEESACINCGLCVRKCIALEAPVPYTDDIDSVFSYAGWNLDAQTHQESSSGGIFSALAHNILARQGVVFGVVWKDKFTAEFRKAETTEDLKRMRGSKYIQAIPGNVYRQVQNEAKTGRPVLFVGTPCQVHALKKYLKKDCSNLLTVDVVCHGVPSHLLLNKYIKEKELLYKKIVKYISFRDKSSDWINFNVTTHFEDGSITSTVFHQDAYMKLFLSDKALNYACYSCPYAHIPRQGDISLGDLWGAERLNSDWPLKLGISSILINSDKGKQAVANISSDLHLVPIPFRRIYDGQKASYSRSSTNVPTERAKVLSKLLHWSLDEIWCNIITPARFGPLSLSRRNLIYRILKKLMNLFRKK